MGRLDGKVALVTGAARGTGEDVARLFAAEGATVVLVDVLDELGREAAKSIGEPAWYRRLDVTREEEWAACVDAILERHGRLDVLVNNAAILEVNTIEDTTPERLRAVTEVNLIGPFLGTRAVIPPMRTGGSGSIVNVASIDALEGEVGVAAYGASKWGLRGLSKCAALELGQHGIRVNTVCPGGGSREMKAAAMKTVQEDLAAGAEIDFSGVPRQPMGRGGTLREISNVILFLASDESSYCSGGDYAVDGAFTAGHIIPGAAGTYAAPPAKR